MIKLGKCVNLYCKNKANVTLKSNGFRLNDRLLDEYEEGPSSDDMYAATHFKEGINDLHYLGDGICSANLCNDCVSLVKMEIRIIGGTVYK